MRARKLVLAAHWCAPTQASIGMCQSTSTVTPTPTIGEPTFAAAGIPVQYVHDTHPRRRRLPRPRDYGYSPAARGAGMGLRPIFKAGINGCCSSSQGQLCSSSTPHGLFCQQLISSEGISSSTWSTQCYGGFDVVREIPLWPWQKPPNYGCLQLARYPNGYHGSPSHQNRFDVCKQLLDQQHVQPIAAGHSLCRAYYLPLNTMVRLAKCYNLPKYCPLAAHHVHHR